MKIAVNTRLLLKDKLEGIGWFACETLRHITTSHPEHQFYFLFDREFSKEFIFSDNITPIVIGPPTRHPVLQYIWFEWSVKRAIKRIKPDVFFSPDGYISLSSKVPTVNTIHDLNFIYHPEHLPRIVQSYLNHFFPKFAKKSSRIVTVSEYSKKDIHHQYGIENDHIDVVFNGASEKFKPVATGVQEKIRAKYTNGDHYFLYVGSIHPRKNLKNLFKAFNLFKEKNKTYIKLLIVGEPMWRSKGVGNELNAMSFKNDVVFTGRVDVDELVRIYGSAYALTFVSYFEGFGIPIIEAFNTGTPVITSNVTSMPEVACDAALLVDPFSVSSISNAMETIIKNPSYREELIQRGYERAKLFSWEKSAEKLWESIQRMLKD